MLNPTFADHATAHFFSAFFGNTDFLEAIEDGRAFKYRPQPDITTYELSLCIYMIMAKIAAGSNTRAEQTIYDLLPPEAQRHFTVVTKIGND